MIAIKRIYDTVDPADGYRVLVDRLWPRGVKREAAALDLWAKAIAPSADLRAWCSHHPDHWAEFQTRYRLELGVPALADELDRLRERAATGRVTLLTAIRDMRENHAVVLRDVLVRRRSRT